MKKKLVIIPARLASTRLFEKPLYSIKGKPLIQHVFEKVQFSMPSAEVWVACCDEKVKSIVNNLGGNAVLTDPNLPSGTDRIYEAYKIIGGSFDIIVNFQGDMISFPNHLIQNTCDVFNEINCDVATAVQSLPLEDIHQPSYVKVAFEPLSQRVGKALYFSRAPIPHGASQYYKHIGIYAYKPDALSKFVHESPSYVEEIEKLEQLRGLSLGLRYGACLIHENCFSIDTHEDVRLFEQA